MMLEYMGWNEAAYKIEKAMGQAILDKKVTYDLARQLEGAKELKSSEFAVAVIERI
jgi:isocitrate dehydrogenase